MKKVLFLSILLVLSWTIAALAASPDQLAKFLPDTLGEYQAKGPFEKQNIRVPGFTGVLRRYVRNGETLSLTILSHPKKSSISIKPVTDIRVKGIPAKLSITKGEKKKVSVLIDLSRGKDGGANGKTTILITQHGTTSSATVVGLASQLDYQGLVKLQ